MNGINSVVILGTLGNKPELKTFANGGKASRISVATSRSWIDSESGERKEKTQWHNVVLRNRQAEIAVQYLDKGDRVGITGYLETRSYVKDNITFYVTEIISTNLQMISTKNKSPNIPAEVSIPPDMDEDLPF